jgi:hypothetical protein
MSEVKQSNLKVLGRDEIYNEATNYLKKGGEPGLKLGFSCLDEYYTHKSNGVTDWTGFPGSGKTFFCLEILFNLSEKYGARHGLFVPDIGSDREIIAKLVKMYNGKDFHDRFNNKITDLELSHALNWIGHHFVIFKKKDFKTGILPVEFWETICGYKDDGGVLNTGLIDSWKNMKHLYSGREDLYLDEVLSTRNELAEQNNKHFHTIAHAVKTTQDQSGKRQIPTASDIKGGGSWNANGKNIVSVDFPDKTHNRVDLYICKVKPEDVGRQGSIIDKLFLDKKRGRYYEKIAPFDYYAFEHEKGFKVLENEQLF